MREAIKVGVFLCVHVLLGEVLSWIKLRNERLEQEASQEKVYNLFRKNDMLEKEIKELEQHWAAQEVAGALGLDVGAVVRTSSVKQPNPKR